MSDRVKFCQQCGDEAKERSSGHHVPLCGRPTCRLEQAAFEQFPLLRNRSMARKLASGRAVDLHLAALLVEGTPELPGLFQLPAFFEGMDYCHVPTENWVHSIGREKSTGKIFVAFDSRFYMNSDYDCLWLR